MDLQVLAVFFGGDGDGAVLAVGLETGGTIGNEVAAADFVAQAVEGLAQSGHVAGEKRFPAAALGQDLEDLVSLGRNYLTFLGADGVDRNAGGFHVADGLAQAGVAPGLFPIADHHEHLGRALTLGISSELPAGIRDRVEEGGASAVGEALDGLAELVMIAGEVLSDAKRVGEASGKTKDRRIATNLLADLC